MNTSSVVITGVAQGKLETTNQGKREDFFKSLVQRRASSLALADGIHGPGTYKGATFTRDARIDGIGWPVVAGQVTFQSTGIVRGIVFSWQVNLTATANVEFVGCVFLAPIVVATGGRIGCCGCEFNGTSCITHAGPAGNANRVGCVGTSALAADGPNVTIIGGV